MDDECVPIMVLKNGLNVVLLGDLVDNGPEVPQLLEYLSTEACGA